MKNALGSILFLLFILSACSTDEPTILKVDTSSKENDPELIEVVTEDEVTDEYIEFTINDEIVRVNLKNIPILKTYLQGVEQPITEINNMEIQKLFEQENNEIYLLSFSCQLDKCSHILLDQNNEHEGILVADLAILDGYNLSPEQSKLLLIFKRTLAQESSLSNIVIIDMNKWTFLSLHNEDIVHNMFDFNWPILSASWIDEDNVSISVPDSLLNYFDETENSNDKINDIKFHVY